MQEQQNFSSIIDIYQATLGKNEFEKLSAFIMEKYGIKLPPIKKLMLQSRLQKRLKALNMRTFKEYVDYVFSPKGQKEEVVHMMNVVSTNKTDFYREPVHFDFIVNTLLPSLYNPSGNLHLKIWSAGCSSGEEPYTIAITLSEFAARNPKFDFSIYATDISTNMLKLAEDGIYKEERINVVPVDLKKKYFLKSKNREEKKVRVIPQLRSKIIFERLNLINDSYHVTGYFDIIFCRNVLIYFERDVQQKILKKLCSYVRNGGYLLLGHSESITGLDLPLKHVQPAIFRKI